jgi:hypothetical protein
MGLIRILFILSILIGTGCECKSGLKSKKTSDICKLSLANHKILSSSELKLIEQTMVNENGLNQFRVSGKEGDAYVFSGVKPYFDTVEINEQELFSPLFQYISHKYTVDWDAFGLKPVDVDKRKHHSYENNSCKITWDSIPVCFKKDKCIWINAGASLLERLPVYYVQECKQGKCDPKVMNQLLCSASEPVNQKGK